MMPCNFSQAEDMQEKTRSMSDACRETMYTSTCSEEDVQSKKVSSTGSSML